MTIYEKLLELSDKEYAAFSSKLTPNLAPELFLGVRVPKLREYAKELLKEGNYEEFLKELPHKYYDENMLHGLLISGMKDYDKCIEEVDKFLPYVDNWAVCDIFSPKVFAKHKEELLAKIKEWILSEKTYTARFGVEMLMSFYLDKDFKPEYLELPAMAKGEDYYIKMMLAWFYATALTKQWDATIEYFKKNTLEVWTHNKTIQKARESYRITPEQKEYLKSLKR